MRIVKKNLIVQKNTFCINGANYIYNADCNFREMMATETDCGDKGEQLRLSLLIRYFNKVPLPAMQLVPTTSMPVSHGPGAKFLTRAQMNLHYVQCHLDNQGASTLIVDLVIKSNHNTKIFAEVIGKNS